MVWHQNHRDGLSVVWRQKHWDGVFRFGLKISGYSFSQFGLKISGFWFPGLGLKIDIYGLVIWALKSPRRFIGLGLKTKRATVCRLRYKTDKMMKMARGLRRDLAVCFG
jgi:hypothetical protein